jgi:hypothetical protein
MLCLADEWAHNLSECADCYAVCLQNKQHEWECLQEERPYNCLNAYKDCLVMCVSLRCFVLLYICSSQPPSSAYSLLDYSV